MNRHLKIDPARIARLDEAADWVVRLSDGSHSDAAVAQWLEWCESHPNNLAAFESLLADWHDLDAVKDIVTSLAKVTALPSPMPPEARARFAVVGRRAGWAMAISLAVSLLVWGVLAAYLPPRIGATAVVRSERANQSARLPDGSSMVLGASSTLQVDFTGQQRDLSLTDGAAYFQVHHDARHPFVVTAGNIKVTAVGTAFDLRKESNITIVTVEEGAVNVVARSSGTNAGRKWRVEAGQRLSYSGEGNATIVVSADAGGGSVKWWDGELAYAGERLGTVIDDVNRYSARRIVIDSDAIAARPYTGTVFTGSIDVWLRAIEDLYHLKAQTTADGETVLSGGE